MLGGTFYRTGQTDLSVPGNGYANILHMTTGEDSCSSWATLTYGCRNPAIFFGPQEGLLVHSAVNGINNQGPLFPSSTLTVGVDTTIEIIQEIDMDGKMMFRVVIDNTEEYKEENKDARDFANVEVYASDPWKLHYRPDYTLGFIKDFSIYVKNDQN